MQLLQSYGKYAASDKCLLSDFFFPHRFLLHVNVESTWLLTSIFGHFWPMRVPVRLNFAKVCFNISAEFCSWLGTRERFGCTNDLKCFSSSFQQRIRQESERKVSTESNQFSLKEK